LNLRRVPASVAFFDAPVNLHNIPLMLANVGDGRLDLFERESEDVRDLLMRPVMLQVMQHILHGDPCTDDAMILNTRLHIHFSRDRTPNRTNKTHFFRFVNSSSLPTFSVLRHLALHLLRRKRLHYGRNRVRKKSDQRTLPFSPQRGLICSDPVSALPSRSMPRPSTIYLHTHCVTGSMSFTSLARAHHTTGMKKRGLSRMALSEFTNINLRTAKPSARPGQAH